MHLRLLLVPVLASACVACGFMPRVKPEPVSYAPTLPDGAPEVSPSTPGAVYRSDYGLVLFEDLKASRVGDLVTILLSERTDASKSVSTTTAKNSELDTGTPTFAGRPVTDGGTEILNNNITGERTFDGEGDASQSNQLNGSITVTIERRLPNGNLLVRGEKWLTLNQGEEFIQISGIIRAADISTANTIPSTRVADARITYSGKGPLASSNKPGWLTRFFSSPWFPY
jgi:flagellar L-ring protein precursor FlgH